MGVSLAYAEAGVSLSNSQKQRLKQNPEGNPFDMSDTHAAPKDERKANVAAKDAKDHAKSQAAKGKGKPNDAATHINTNRKDNDLSSIETRNAHRAAGGTGKPADNQAGSNTRPKTTTRNDAKSSDPAVRDAANKSATAQSAKGAAKKKLADAEAAEKKADAEKREAKRKK